MKTLLRTFFSLLLFFISVGINAQSDNHYIYIEVRGLSAQRGVPELKQQLMSVTAIDSIAYCENVGLAVIHTITPSPLAREQISRILQAANYRFIIKSSLPIEEVNKICFKNTHLLKEE